MLSYKPLLAITTLILFFSNAFGQNAFWRLQYPKVPAEVVNDIHFTNKKEGFIVCDGGAIVKTTDGGYNWTTLDYQTFEDLNTIYFLNNQRGWIGGDRGTIFTTNNSGYTWTSMNFTDSITIAAMCFTSQNTGFVVGDSCIFKTTNGGASWNRKVFKNGMFYPSITYVEFFGLDTGYAFYYGSLLKTTDGGINWTQQVLNKPFYKIDFANQKIGWAISDSNIYDIYYKTTDGGNTWSFQNRVVNYNKYLSGRYITSLQVLDTNNVFILNDGTGQGNTRLYYTNNGGATWGNNNFSPFTWSTALHFTTPKTGHVGFLWGRVSSTFDVGATWTYNNMQTAMHKNIFFRNRKFGWAMAGMELLRTNDGGTTWRPSTTKLTSGFANFSFPDTIKGWAVNAQGDIYRSLNSGDVWTVKTAAYSATDIAFYDTSFGMVSRSDGKMAITHNAGNSWTQVNLGTTRNIKKVRMSDSLHWLAYGINNGQAEIYKTINAGSSWSVHLSNDLDGYAVPDTATAYFIGGEMYKSTDGGKTQVAANLPWDKQLPNASISAYDSAHIVACAGDQNTFFQNDKLLISNNAGNSYKMLRANCSHAGRGVYYLDSNNIWLLNAFGSIFHYDPNYVSDQKYQPFFSVDTVIACVFSQVSLSIANYATYTSSDTLKITLKQGSNILQTLSANSSGVTSFTTPSSTGTYILEAKMTNPKHTVGEATAIPIIVKTAATPVFSYWYGVSNPQCIKDGAMIGLSYTNIGRDAVYELHMIKKGSTDSIISTDQPFTLVTGFTDSFKLYYKVWPGQGCWTTPVFCTDTLSINVKQLQATSAHFISDKISNTSCWGDSIKITAKSQNLGTNPVYTFYKKSLNGTITQLATSADSNYKIAALTDTASYFARIFPGYGGCILTDTFSSDTITLFPLPLASVLASINSDKPLQTLCAGDTVNFTLSTSTPLASSVYTFYVRNKGVNILVQSDTLASYKTDSLKHNDSVFCKITMKPGVCIQWPILTDTLVMQVSPLVPIQSSITSNKPSHSICNSDSISFTVATTLSLDSEVYTFYKISGGVETLLQSDTLNVFRSNAFANNDMIYCRIIPSHLNQCIDPSMITTDSITVIVNTIPGIPIISSSSDTLFATVIPGATYIWYLNGKEIQGSPGPFLVAGKNGGVYTVNASVNNCISEASAPHHYQPVFIEARNPINERFKVYPNPATHILLIASAHVPYDAEIKNVHGSIVYRAYNITTKTLSIPLTEYAQGVYFIILHDEKETAHIAIIKQ